jgi:hypothetical protein
MPANEIRLNAINASEIPASAIFHRFQAIAQIPIAATSQTAATHLDVVQSQLIAVDPLEIEQPHGREAMTTTEITAATSARAPNARAMKFVVRRVRLRATTWESMSGVGQWLRRYAAGALRLFSARSASAVETRGRRKFLNAKRSQAVSAADRLPSVSKRYQCIHSWQ